MPNASTRSSLKQTIGSAARRLLPSRAYFAFCRLFDQTITTARVISSLGVGRQCPFCNLPFRKFLSDPGEPSELFRKTHIVGGGPSTDALCPFCRSFERERHVYLYLKLMTPLFQQNVRLLHIAPERNLGRKLSRRRNIDYTSGDLNPTRAQVRVDLTAIDFPDAGFDVVICNHVLEHIPDDRAAMSELKRILRPGGWAMLQVPIAPGLKTHEDPSITSDSDRLRLYGQHDHVRLYGSDYAQKLQQAGFHVSTPSVSATQGNAAAHRFGLLPDEQIYIATKPLAKANTQTDNPITARLAA